MILTVLQVDVARTIGILRDAVVSWPRPASNHVSYKGIAITNDLEVDGEKLLSVNNCHSIFFVWTCDPDVGTIDGPSHTCKVCNVVKRSLGISQVLWE